MRPGQWIKNAFVFLPVFFDGKLMNADCLVASVIVFFAFCMAASGVYCLNDVVDVEADRLHSKKCNRPVACGAISKNTATGIASACMVVSFLIVLCVGKTIFFILALYVLMNIAYCVKLKHIAIVDVLVIAIGFVLRVVIGGYASSVNVSHWIVLMTFLLALFLALAKRRDDVVVYDDTGVVLRKNVVNYNIDFMNQTIGIVASITMVCYIMYTLSEEVTNRLHTNYLYVTALFVLAGIMRYLQLTVVDVKSGSPTQVFMNDRFTQVCVLLWILSFVYFIYF